MKTIIPPKLQPGDTIGIMSPASALAPKHRQRFNHAIKEVETKLQLKVTVHPQTWSQHYYRAGTTKQRVDAFHSLISDDTIKAIIFSYGGKGSVDLLEHIDWDLIKSHPKIITGISNPAILLSNITLRTGLVTYFGVEFIKTWGIGISDYELANIKGTWFTGDPNPTLKHNPDWKLIVPTNVPESNIGWQILRQGKASGQLFGGTISGLMRLVGTPYAPNFQNKIFFFEGYQLADNAFHSHLVALKLAGAFDQIKGLIIGYIYNHLGDRPSFNRSYQDIIDEVLGDQYHFPVIYLPDIGHEIRNLIMPLGIQATLDTNLKLPLSFSQPTVL